MEERENHENKRRRKDRQWSGREAECREDEKKGEREREKES